MPSFAGASAEVPAAPHRSADLVTPTSRRAFSPVDPTSRGGGRSAQVWERGLHLVEGPDRRLRFQTTSAIGDNPTAGCVSSFRRQRRCRDIAGAIAALLFDAVDAKPGRGSRARSSLRCRRRLRGFSSGNHRSARGDFPRLIACSVPDRALPFRPCWRPRRSPMCPSSNPL